MSAFGLLVGRGATQYGSCRHALLRRASQASQASRASQASQASPSYATYSTYQSYQSYPLPSNSTPLARNTTATESSISHSIQQPSTQAHQTRSQLQRQSKPPTSVDSQTGVPIAIPDAIVEQEALPSRPEFATAPGNTAGKTDKTRTRLRAPRKAAMKLTPTAVEHLRSLLDGPEPKLIKVGVRNRGCSGLSYNLEYVDKAGAFDEVVEQEGVRVIIDSKALFSIIGSEMDWVEDTLSERFVFRNPNISEYGAWRLGRWHSQPVFANGWWQRRNVGVGSPSAYEISY